MNRTKSILGVIAFLIVAVLVVIATIGGPDEKPTATIKAQDIIGTWNCDSDRAVAISDGGNLILKADGTFSQTIFASTCRAYDELPPSEVWGCNVYKGTYTLERNELTLREKERYSYITEKDLALVNPIRARKYLEPMRIGWERVRNKDDDFTRIKITAINDDFLRWYGKEFRVGKETRSFSEGEKTDAKTCYRIRDEGMFSVAPKIEEVVGEYQFAFKGFSGEMKVSAMEAGASDSERPLHVTIKTSAYGAERFCNLEATDIPSERKTDKATIKTYFRGHDTNRSGINVEFVALFANREAIVYVNRERISRCGERGWIGGKWRKRFQEPVDGPM